jgi:hypothetical protein
MKVKSKAVLRSVVIGVFLSALACSALTGGSGGSGGGADSGRTLADSLPDETHPGDYIAYMGYYFAVLQVKDPGALSEKSTALELVIGNQSGAMYSPFSFSFGGISDGGGRVFGQSFAGDEKGIRIDPTVFLTRGERVRGWLYFSVPDGVRPVSLKFSLIHPEGGWKEFSYGLTPPPSGYKALQVDTAREQPERSAFGKAATEKGASLTVLQVEDNLEEVPGIFFAMPSDARVVRVDVQIANTGGARLTFHPIAILDGEGYVYPPAVSEVMMMQGKNSLAAGESFVDKVYFVVPSSFAPDSVRLIFNPESDPMENLILRSALS